MAMTPTMMPMMADRGRLEEEAEEEEALESRGLIPRAWAAWEVARMNMIEDDSDVMYGLCM